MPDDLKPPTPTIGDHLHALAKGIIGEIPLGGSTVAEVIGIVFGPPLERRRQKWSEQIVSALLELQRRDVNVEKIRDDPAFADVVLRATSVAMCTHQQEKLDALRNAILNSGLSRSPDEDLRQMFLGMVERFTPWHIHLMSLFNNPSKWFSKNGQEFPRHVSSTNLLELALIAFPQLKAREEFTEQVCRELQQFGLVIRSDLGVVRLSGEPEGPRTLDLGKQFVRFIEKPE